MNGLDPKFSRTVSKLVNNLTLPSRRDGKIDFVGVPKLSEGDH